VIWIYAGAFAAVVLAAGAAYQLVTGAAEGRMSVSGALAGTVEVDAPRSRAARLSRWFSRTRIGRWLERELVLAGVKQPPLAVFAVVVAATVTLPYVLAQALAPVFGVLGLASGWLLLRWWLRRGRERRRERFVQQIPELARVLANATNAGLSISTAWAVAETELAEPAKTEIKRLNASIRFGASLEEAMLQLNDRLPAREVRVLMSTLVVSARSGGSLIKALRDISLTLDERKEVRREVRTTLTQSRATGALVTLMGLGILLVLNAIQPGTVERMTTSLLGQIALVVTFAMFATGHLLVRRMTRIDH
jgi:tight adherence protein B